MPGDKVKELLRLRARVKVLEEELFEPHCDICGKWVNILCHDDVWTCQHHAAVCTECWAEHECRRD